jgi:hypothetical protein
MRLSISNGTRKVNPSVERRKTWCTVRWVAARIAAGDERDVGTREVRAWTGLWWRV